MLRSLRWERDMNSSLFFFLLLQRVMSKIITLLEIKCKKVLMRCLLTEKCGDYSWEKNMLILL